MPEETEEVEPTVEIGLKDGEINLAFTTTNGKYERRISETSLPSKHTP